MTNALTYARYLPGALAGVLKLHIDYYHQNWNFGLQFETKVAGELAEFLGRKDDARDLFLCAYSSDGKLLGSITIDARNAARKGAHLRWFIVAPEATGQRIGQVLITRAIKHCDAMQYPQTYLTTFKGLDAARHLYNRYGFVLEDEKPDDQWHGGVIEQRFVRPRGGIGETAVDPA